METVRAKHGDAGHGELHAVTEQNVVLQLQHLKTHPAVASRVASGEVSLHGWVYDIGTGGINCYDEAQDAFVPMQERYSDILVA